MWRPSGKSNLAPIWNSGQSGIHWKFKPHLGMTNLAGVALCFRLPDWSQFGGIVQRQAANAKLSQTMTCVGRKNPKYISHSFPLRLLANSEPLRGWFQQCQSSHQVTHIARTCTHASGALERTAARRMAS